MANNEIYSLWIDGPLQPINELTIASAREWKHKLIIYSYDELPKNIDCEVRDAREILPESEIFYYSHMDSQYKFGGIAERLKAEMLYKLGGWHIDLDVTLLNSLSNIQKDYVFRPHRLGVVGNIIKAPKESLLARYYLAWTKTINKSNTEFEKSFAGLNAAVTFLELQRFIVPPATFGMDEDKYFIPLLQSGGMYPDSKRKAIHWCTALGHYKNFEPGSFLDGLYKHYKIDEHERFV